MTSPFLTAEWRQLIMAQYQVDPSTLLPWLPHGLELDLYRDGEQSRCYVSLVGFLFDRVRVKGIPFPFHTRFEEVNLRFYVVRKLADGTRQRGVVFISELVPRVAISFLARTLYDEPYQTVAMRHEISHSSQSRHVEYAWRIGATWNRIAVDADLHAQPIASGSVEEFITEHYWGYTKRRRGTTSEYGVQHPRWSIYPIQSHGIKADLGSLYGSAFSGLVANAPDNILLAEGSPVSVSDGTRLQD
jgi:uncharacterized protein YqjF (DUF2071 family)